MRSQNFKKRSEERKSQLNAVVVEDERFKLVDSNRFLNKPTKNKTVKEAVPGLVKPKVNSKKTIIAKNKLLSGRKEGRTKRNK